MRTVSDLGVRLPNLARAFGAASRRISYRFRFVSTCLALREVARARLAWTSKSCASSITVFSSLAAPCRCGADNPFVPAVQIPGITSLTPPLRHGLPVAADYFCKRWRWGDCGVQVRGEAHGGLVTQGRVRSFGVVIGNPGSNQVTGMGDVAEQGLVQKFVPHAAYPPATASPARRALRRVVSFTASRSSRSARIFPIPKSPASIAMLN